MKPEKRNKLLSLITRRSQSVELNTKKAEPKEAPIVLVDPTPVSIVPIRKTEQIKDRLRFLKHGERVTDWTIAEVPARIMPFVRKVRESIEDANMVIVSDIIANAMKTNGQFVMTENTYIDSIDGPTSSNLPVVLDQVASFQPVSFEGESEDGLAFVYISSQRFTFNQSGEPQLEVPSSKALEVISDQKSLSKVVEWRHAVAVVEEGSDIARSLAKIRPVDRISNKKVQQLEPLKDAA